MRITTTIATRTALAGAALGLIATIGVPSSASAGKELPALLSATPNPAVASQVVTTTPNIGCDGFEVDLTYTSHLDFSTDAQTVTLDEGDSADDLWSAQMTFDAGKYDVDATCVESIPQNNAGHLAVAGDTTFFDYQGTSFQVNGIITAPDTATVGQSINFGPRADSLCLAGSVALSIKNPDGSVTVPLAPAVDGTGTWTAPATFAAPGTYELSGTCSFTPRADAGHRAVAGLSLLLFDYLAHTVVVTAPTVETPAATPVVAAANFTG